VLIFLMSGTTGMFPPKISLRSYFDNASGLRMGAPVRLEGVDIGNVEAIHIIRDNPQTPVEVTMKVSSKYELCVAQRLSDVAEYRRCTGRNLCRY